MSQSEFQRVKVIENAMPEAVRERVLALNAGMRDSEIRGLEWGRVNLTKAFLAVGRARPKRVKAGRFR